MNGHHWQLALRKWVEHFNQRTVFIILFGVALILGVSGPFSTGETTQLLPRLLYWAESSIATYAIGSYAAFFAQQVFPHQTRARQAKAVLFGTLEIKKFLFIFNGLFEFERRRRP